MSDEPKSDTPPLLCVEAFEKWAKGNNYDLAPPLKIYRGMWRYCDDGTERALALWQAAWQACERSKSDE